MVAVAGLAGLAGVCVAHAERRRHPVRPKWYAPGESSGCRPARGQRSGRNVEVMNHKPRRLSARWVRAVGPVLPIALFGAVWIVLHATTGRAGAHTLFQALALAECTIALLLRGRKPVGALAGILVVYALADLDTIMILPVLLAVATVADRRGQRTAAVAMLVTALVVVAMPFVHGDRVSVLAGTLPHLGAVALAAGLGAWVRAHRHPVVPVPAGPGGSAAMA
jgi:hypothetical protein